MTIEGSPPPPPPPKINVHFCLHVRRVFDEGVECMGSGGPWH